MFDFKNQIYRFIPQENFIHDAVQGSCNVIGHDVTPDTCSYSCNCVTTCTYTSTSQSCQQTCQTCYYTCYDGSILLSYQYNNNQYANWMSVETKVDSSNQVANDLNNKYPLNHTITCFFDKFNPNDVRLSKGSEAGFIAGIVIFSIIGFILLVVWLVLCINWKDCDCNCDCSCDCCDRSSRSNGIYTFSNNGNENMDDELHNMESHQNTDITISRKEEPIIPSQQFNDEVFVPSQQPNQTSNSLEKENFLEKQNPSNQVFILAQQSNPDSFQSNQGFISVQQLQSNQNNEQNNVFYNPNQTSNSPFYNPNQNYSSN